MIQFLKATKLKRIFKLNIPIIGVLLIMAFISLLQTPLLKNLRTEAVFGWILLVFMPLAMLLGLVQLYLWLRWLSQNSTPQLKKSLQIVFLAALSVFAMFIFLRWTL